MGIKFIVHPPYEVPVINSMGYAVSPGAKAFIGFSKTSVSELVVLNGCCKLNVHSTLANIKKQNDKKII